MAYKIVHSPLAEKSFLQNIAYLESEWSIKEINSFIKRTSEVLEILKKDPFVFPKWEFNSEVRKVVLLKQISLFYTINDRRVEIHLFWNNSRNPEKLGQFF